MTQFKVGDRVRDTVEEHSTYGETGTVVGVPWNYAARVKYDKDGSYGLYFKGELELIEPEFVHVVERREIWVTLPGDTAGHKLTEEQARTLFRQLEEIV